MRNLSVLLFVTGLVIVIAGTMTRGGLATFTDQSSVSDNTFASSSVFPTKTPTPTPTNTPTPTPTPIMVSYGAAGDSYVKSDDTAANFGTDTSMIVDGNISKLRRALVQFDVSTIPAGSTVSDGTLTLCLEPGNNSPGHVHELRMVTSSWSEAGVTWTNQPSVSATVTDSLTVPASDQCFSLDVTADVQAWVDGTTNYGWRQGNQNETGGGAKVDYWTREHGTPSLRPTLDVSYSPP